MGGALSKYHVAESLDIWLLVDQLHPQVLNKDLWGKKGPNAALPQRTSYHGGHTLYLSPVAGQHSSSDLLQVSGQRESGVESTGFPSGSSRRPQLPNHQPLQHSGTWGETEPWRLRAVRVWRAD